MHDYFGDSGHVSEVTIKTRPDATLSNRFRCIHWNPGICIPKRGWIHAYSWDPPEVVELEQGPIYVELRRSGPFPLIPEANLGVTYRFFTERNYVYVGTRIDIVEDVGVMSLRNDEWVYDLPTFTHLAWMDPDGQMTRGRLEDWPRTNRHGDILRLDAKTPFVAFWNPTTGVGAATVRLAMMNTGPMGRPPTEFDQATYVSRGSTHEVYCYWFHSQIYFNVGWDRSQLMTVPEGSTFSDRNMICFFDAETEGLGAVVELRRAADRPYKPMVGTGGFPPPR
jgi:hypothetical protein